MKEGFTFDEDDDNAYADVVASELANGIGYTTGGATLSGVSVDINESADTVSVTWSNVEWTATGGTLVADGAIIYDDSTATTGDDYTDAIVGYITTGATLTASDGKKIILSSLGITL